MNLYVPSEQLFKVDIFAISSPILHHFKGISFKEPVTIKSSSHNKVCLILISENNTSTILWLSHLSF